MGFFDPRDDLAADRTVFVRGIDQVEKVRRDGERELVIREFRAGIFLGRQRRHQPMQLLERGNAVLELPVPVVPVRIRNVAPEAPAGGMKFFESLECATRRRLFPVFPRSITVHVSNLVSAL